MSSKKKLLILIILLIIFYDKKNYLQNLIYNNNKNNNIFTKTPSIKILLSSIKKSCKIFFKASFSILIRYKGKFKSFKYKHPYNIKVSIYKNKIRLYLGIYNILIDSIEFLPHDGIIGVNSNIYKGKIKIIPIKIKNKNRLLVINTLLLNNYLESILFYKINKNKWNNPSLEFLRTLAIISRTYSLYNIIHSKSPYYNLSDKDSFQIYKGIIYRYQNNNISKSIKKAIESTKGIVLFFNNQIIKPYIYNKCYNYFNRNHNNRIFFTLGYNNIKNFLNKYFRLNIINIKNINTSKVVILKNNILELQFYIKNNHIIHLCLNNIINLNNLDFKILKNLKNNSLKINVLFYDKQEKIIFFYKLSNRYGLCESEAIKKIEKGYNFKDILHLFFPSTEIYKIWE